MQIAISDISLDVTNFRHGNVSSQREALIKLLSDEKAHKISELAQDIIEMGGLDPSSLLIVTQDPSNPGQYTALEGNRRIAALKTLINPDIAAGLPTHGQFKKLSGDFLALGISSVEGVVLDRDAAFNWIKRKHYKAMGGRGVVEWNAVATARSDASEGKVARWLAALDFLEAQGEATGPILERIAAKTTTVERVFSSQHMGSVLGITFDRAGNITPENGDRTGAMKLLIAMFQKMGEKDFVETLVTNADLQEKFIIQFAAMSVKKPAASGAGQTSKANTASGKSGTSSGSGAGNSAGNTNSTAGGGGATQSQAQNSQAGATARSKPVKQRAYLAPGGLRISNHGLNRLYAELRKLKVEASPHIGAAMIRIFLEKATMVFLDDMAVTCANPNGWQDSSVKLRTKVAEVLRILDVGRKDRRLDYARDIANATQDKTHTLDHLNRAIHSHLAIPSALEIITGWDRLHPYFESLFDHLEKNGK